jgi:uncharacterized integral membrane protein
MSKWNQIKFILADKDTPLVLLWLLSNLIGGLFILLAVGIFIDAIFLGGRYA